MNKENKKIPTYDSLFNSVLKALKDLGGSGSIEEINQKVIENEHISEEISSIPHGKDNSAQTEVEYRLAWSRTYLKTFGLLENSNRGIWGLTAEGSRTNQVVPKEVVKNGREKLKKSQEIKQEKSEPDDIQPWKEKLLNILTNIDPSKFEKLAQRLLRESGFTQVIITGKAGDGGVDGKGLVRINGFLSFHVIFQCKRYKGSITPEKIRDFRGAMQGRADKGLFITTGSFTKEAIKEATRDGVPPIDLIDGELLCEKLKEFRLGIITQLTETVEIREDWFNNF